MCWFLCCPKTTASELQEGLITQESEFPASVDTRPQNLILQPPKISPQNGKSPKQAQIQEKSFAQEDFRPLKPNYRLRIMDQMSIRLKTFHRVSSKQKQLQKDVTPMKKLVPNQRCECTRKYSENEFDFEDKKPCKRHNFTNKSQHHGSQGQQVNHFFKLNKSPSEIALYLSKEAKLKYIYSNRDPENPIYILFKCRKRIDLKQPLQYYLEQNQGKLICLIGVPRAINSKIDTLRKSQSHIWAINYGHGSDGIYQLSVSANKFKFFNFKKMDKIFLLIENFGSYKQAYNYVMEIVSNLTLKDRHKIVFFFPSSISMPSISKILHAVYKQEISKLNIEKFVSEFYFDFDYFETPTSETGIIVKLNFHKMGHKPTQYDSIQTALSIVGKHFNHERYYLILIELFNLIKKRPSNDLVSLKKLFIENSKEFKHKIRQLKNYDPLDLIIKEYENYSLQNPEVLNKDYTIILEKQKRKIQKHFQKNHKKEPQTPITREWDDDLEEFDIKVPRKISAVMDSPVYSGLDSLGNQQIEKIDLFFESQIDQCLGLWQNQSSDEFNVQEMDGIKQEFSDDYDFIEATRKHSWD